MRPYYADDHATFYAGDSRLVLPHLPEKSVQCVVTSPPYFGLRDYGTGMWEGGDPECDHKHKTEHQKQGATSQRKGRANTEAQRNENYRDRCGRCGAKRVDLQIGQEPTPAEFCQALVQVFREVRRVLRDDGTVFLNLGDSYTSGGRQTHGTRVGHKQQTNRGMNGQNDPPRNSPAGFKPKDRLGIPHRAVFALQEDGWYWRDEIIWHNVNAMPESVTDRTTGAHEFVFLLTKKPRYFYDADALREPVAPGPGRPNFDGVKSELLRVVAESIGVGSPHPLGRNARSVWALPTSSFHGSHFAVMPPRLVERCIRAGTSERGACAKCGAPWRRVVESETTGVDDRRPNNGAPGRTGKGFTRVRGGDPVVTTIGWEPTCDCGCEETVPCKVLDPFSGAATTVMVTNRLGRDGVGIDLNPAYLDLGIKRLQADRTSRLTGIPVKRPTVVERMVRPLFGDKNARH